MQLVNSIQKKDEINEEEKVNEKKEEIAETIKKEEEDQREEIEEIKETATEPILNISFSLKKQYNLLKNHHKR